MKIRKYLLFCILLILLLVGGCSFLLELPDIDVPISSTIYDCNGQVISVVFEHNREFVSIEDVSPHFLKAIVAIEDHRFFQHKGLDLQAIARAFIRNLKAGTTVEGGSTISQQTAKVLFLTHDRTYTRKIKEAILTLQLEREYTKKEILEQYVNAIYFGHGAYGIETAAKTYFGKSAKDLTLSESAILAGLVRGPAFYSPINKPEASLDRRNIVLTRMTQLGIINDKEANTAKNENLKLTKKSGSNKQAPFFTDMVADYIIDNLEDGSELLYRGGLSIYTTLDLNMQQAAETFFSKGLEGYEEELEGALVALNPHSGEIKALVGGRDYKRSQLNRVTTAQRQPGSAFKPFVYTAAIDSGQYTSASTLQWEITTYQLPNGNVWTPTEYGDKQYDNQSFTLKQSLAISSNVLAAKLINDIGPAKVAEYAKIMGIKSTMGQHLSLSLGTSEVTPLEITSAFGTLAANGVKAEAYFINKVIDKENRVLLENRPQLDYILEKKTAFIVTDMLKAVLQPGGTAARAGGIINRPAAGKTGTTDDYKDAWFIGYTPELVAGVYIGYDNHQKPVNATGGGLAAPIWSNFMKQALTDIPVKDFIQPDGLVSVAVCSDTGLLATSESPQIVEVVLVEGTEPTEFCPNHRKVNKDEGSNNNDSGTNFFDWFFSW